MEDNGKLSSSQEYERAVMTLNSTQCGHNFGHLADSKTKKIDMILNCLARINLTLAEIDRLAVIHVAGSKGKGSTCEYVDSILRCHGYKTGLFRSVYNAPPPGGSKERIRINGKPVRQAAFTSAFWRVFNRLQTTRTENQDLMPGYFGLVLLMALQIFVEEKVDVAILEVGIGGEYDATNFVPKPVVWSCLLHLEHTDVLGHTVEEIAWHKAGIMKSGVPLVTVQHQDSVMKVIVKRARERGCPVAVTLPIREESLGQPLGIPGERQTVNASLALHLCRTWRQRTQRSHRSLLQGAEKEKQQNAECPEDVTSVRDIPQLECVNVTLQETQGLTKARLPGRNQIVKRGSVTYYLDGAHTTRSMQQCAEWFKTAAQREADEIGGKVCRSLVFRMKQSKTATDHFPYLADCGFSRAAFCPHVVSTSAKEHFPDSMDLRDDPAQSRALAVSQLQDWGRVTSHAPCLPVTCPSIVSALWWAGLTKDTPLQAMATVDLSLEDGVTCSAQEPPIGAVSHVQVLVTGSLVMVGGALTVLKADLWD